MKRKLISLLLLNVVAVGLNLSSNYTANSVHAVTTTKEKVQVNNAVTYSNSTKSLLSEKIYGPIPINSWGKGPGFTWYDRVPSDPYRPRYWRRGNY